MQTNNISTPLPPGELMADSVWILNQDERDALDDRDEGIESVVGCAAL
ncbi:MAG: hypothetical protein JXR73_04260 [Candidatus Omnitrophica bacterium]|nr:hypothetical protein [Candidatus Omnitrophota bacterium]